MQDIESSVRLANLVYLFWHHEDMVGSGRGAAGRAGAAGTCGTAGEGLAGDQGGETGMAEGATGGAREARADAIKSDGAHQ